MAVIDPIYLHILALLSFTSISPFLPIILTSCPDICYNSTSQDKETLFQDPTNNTERAVVQSAPFYPLLFANCDFVQELAEVDPGLQGFADHFAYRQQRYEEVKNNIEENEGVLEEFSTVFFLPSAAHSDLSSFLLNE